MVANKGMSWANGMLYATDADGRYALRDFYRIENNGEKWSHHYVYGWTPDCVVSSSYYNIIKRKDTLIGNSANPVKNQNCGSESW